MCIVWLKVKRQENGGDNVPGKVVYRWEDSTTMASDDSRIFEHLQGIFPPKCRHMVDGRHQIIVGSAFTCIPKYMMYVLHLEPDNTDFLKKTAAVEALQ